MLYSGRSRLLGDAGLTAQPPNAPYDENAATQLFVSQYIALAIQTSPQADASIFHIVQFGQSLCLLTHHYDVHIEQLRGLNKLGSGDML